MGKMRKLREMKKHLEDTDRRQILKYLTVFTAVFSVAAAGVFIYQAQDTQTQKIDFSGEINSSENEMVLEFFNETAEIIMEQSDKSRFYIDLDIDGSADIRLDKLIHDGNARKDSIIFDYRSGAYLLEFRYSEDANRTEDGWLRPLKITKLG